MSIQTELTRITNAKTAIKTAIEGKGVTVPEATLLDGMSALIESIEAGGGGVVFTYGSFTPSEAIELNTSTTNPAYVVEHNLGVVPNLFFMGKFSNSWQDSLDLFIVRWHILNAGGSGLHTAAQVAVGGSTTYYLSTSNCIDWPITANAMPIIPAIARNNCILSPQQYYWVAIGGLTE